MNKIRIKDNFYTILTNSDLFRAAVIVTEAEELQEKQLEFANKKAKEFFNNEIFIAKGDRNGKTYQKLYR